MKISDISVRFFGYEPKNPVINSVGTIKRRNMCLVEIIAEDGTIGIGESWINFPSWASLERKATIIEGIRPLLIGRDATDVIGTHALLIKSLELLALQTGSIGTIYQAISGVDLALWDLAGKIHGLPVFRMLGSVNSKIPVYASGIGPRVSKNDVMKQVSRGIKGFKLKVGFGFDEDLAELEELRRLVGEDATIMVDANQAWDVRTTKKMLGVLKSFRIAWLEEPIRSDDFDGMVELTRISEVPIAAGENLYGRKTFAKWAGQKAFSIAQPDVAKVGGFTEALAIAQMIKAWEIPYAPHYLGSIIGLIASCHLFAAVSGGIWVELDSNENPLREEILESGLLIENGLLKLSDEPGWGIVLNEDKLKLYEIA